MISLRLEKERLEFISLIENKNPSSVFNPLSTAKFWFTNRDKMPYLASLAVILINIPASSAYIERFYSICGNVCKQRAGNMSPETIISRSMLKANIGILNELTDKSSSTSKE